jgi:hypothetical protein
MPLAAASRTGLALERPTIAIEIGDAKIRYAVTLSVPLFDAMVDAERKGPAFADAEDKRAASRAVERLFSEKNTVTIDGIRVRPVLSELEFVPAEAAPGSGRRGAAGAAETYEDPGILAPDVLGPGLGAGEGAGFYGPGPAGGARAGAENVARGHVSFVLSFGTKGKPRRVSLVWELFPEAEGERLKEVRAGLAAYDDFREILFTPEEPEFIWHALEKPSGRTFLEVRGGPPRRRLFVPLVPVALLGGLVVFLVIAKRTGLGHGVLLPVSAATVALALGVSALRWAEVALAWTPSLEKPDAEEAGAIFESLHRNIYRAFDYRSEEDIYDVLAQSVDGELLDEIYGEVYESLILRDQGGAVCRIQSVNVLEMEIKAPPAEAGAGGEGFEVECRWQVKGAVSHWGHTHFRTNGYRAVYTVEPRRHAWKITRARVLEHKRIDTTSLDEKAGRDPASPGRSPGGVGDPG